MKIFAKLTNKLIFSDRNGGDQTSLEESSRYQRMWSNTVISVALVSLVPLVVMTLVNYYLFERTFTEESIHPVSRITAITKKSLESFLGERVAASKYVISTVKFQDLINNKMLNQTLKRMKKVFGSIVDIGVIDRDGGLLAYAGPYELEGKNYKDQDWFHKVFIRDEYISDVFLGHRKQPHFIIAVKVEDEDENPHIFRVTIDTEILEKQVLIAGLDKNSDAFIVSKEGKLQTPSRFVGANLEKVLDVLPPYTEGTEILEDYQLRDSNYILGYSYISNSPFIFMILTKKTDLIRGWITFESEIVVFMIVSMIAVLILIMGITSNWVTRIKNADIKREATLHNIEHTNKMASIGRLAAGVAHEINNPLAIINEKAGLLKDIVGFTEDMPKKEKLNKQLDAILLSVKRCSDITHRLLGFARHMDVKREPVAVNVLIREVLGFLENEAKYRDIKITINVPEVLPTVVSDKSQLQQLFLNIINNAFDAMKKGGHLEIDIEDTSEESVTVTIKDDGGGIPQKDLERIFEPFFTTKKTKGTGLGLSICYGIVKKLKGEMTVDSEMGKGTVFRIVLPKNEVRRRKMDMDKFSVLIVDDEKELVTTLVERLEIRGYKAKGVNCGNQALKSIEKENFDVVLLDVKMPGEDGVEVMKKIKKIRWNIPVILLTGHMSSEASEQGLKAGAIDYLIKPVNIDDLIVKMKEAIRLYRP